MIRHKFYDLPEYRHGQSEVAKNAWAAGVYDSRRAEMQRRKCRNEVCGKYYKAISYDPKVFCSHRCSAAFNNRKRGRLPLEWRKKISTAMKNVQSCGMSNKGKILVPRLVKQCLTCDIEFQTPRHQNHKYCSVKCSIYDIGRRRTSPRAARAIAGVRPDINQKIYFYSRWEANFARVLNLLNIKWEFQPKTFDLGFQNYTPDFYLPESNTYVEIKNFLSDYSSRRHNAFKKLYPKEKLILVLKDKYIKLQENFSNYIENWEFS